jgi:hypothetical protein
VSASTTPWIEEALFLVAPPDPLFGFPTLPRLLRTAADRDNNIVTFTTDGKDDYVAMLENALCGLSKVGVTNVVIFALDPEVFKYFRQRGYAVSLVYDPASEPERFWASANKKAEPYPYTGHKRPEITAAVLRLGYNVLAAGSDIAFLSEPFEAILSTRPGVGSDSYYVSEQTDAAVDVYFQNDKSGLHVAGIEEGAGCSHLEPAGIGAPVNEMVSVCADLVYAISNTKSLALFDSISRSQGTVVFTMCGSGKLGARNGILVDQSWINLYLSRYHLVAKYQPIHARTFAHVLVLDRARFPNGHVMFGREIPRGLGVCPAIVHVNWMRSGPKLMVLRKHGLFELERENSSTAWRCIAHTPLDASGRCPLHPASPKIQAALVSPITQADVDVRMRMLNASILTQVGSQESGLGSGIL